MDNTDLANDHPIGLETQILELNERLEAASHSSMSRAFNLGCSTGLIPAAVAVIAVFYLFKGSVIGTVLTALVLALGIVAFANLSAYLARARTIQRVYKEIIYPEIETILGHAALTRQEFDHLADRTLPQQALLRMFLKPVNENLEEITEQPAEE